MAKDDKLKSPARRSFFTKAGSGVAGAAVLGLTAGTAAAAAEPKPDDRTAASYRETDHVKAAYRTARF